VLLWLALWRLSGSVWCSAFVAAVFAVHPLHVESVAWATQRKDVLAGIFFGLTLLLWARFRERPGVGRYAAAAFAFCLGLLSKPTVVTTPFVLLLLDEWPLRRLRHADGRLDPQRLRAAITEKLPLLALALMGAWITWIVQSAFGATGALSGVPFPARLGNAVVSYDAYLRDAFWPRALAVDYPHPGDALSPLAIAASGGLLVVLTLLAARQVRVRPQLLVGWLWFVGMLVPAIGLVQVGFQARADRYTYLPLSGLAIAVAWTAAFWTGSDRLRRVVVCAAGVVAIAGLALVARVQTSYWRDSVALFERAVSVAPNHRIAHHRLAIVYAQRGDLERAGRHYAEVFRLAPEDARPHFEWGRQLELDERLTEAIAEYQQAVALLPAYARGQGRLALALQRAGRSAEALPHFELALVANPDAPGLRRGLAHALAALGRHAEAVAQRRAWLRLEPDSADAANDLAWALATCPDANVRAPEEALALIRSVLSNRPDDPNLLDTLAAAYAANARFEQATRFAAEAVRHASDDGSRAAFAQRLALYEQGTAYIEQR
jgi:tetratricopeptide (TPR) repeat protein